MTWFIPYNDGSLAPLEGQEQAQKQENTIRLLTLLDPAFNSCQGMCLHRTLALHSSKSSNGGTLSEEIDTLLLHVISLRRRDYAYCKTAYTDNEQHAFVVRSLMQLCNMYRSQCHFTEEEFKEYLRDDTPPQCQSFQWNEQQQRHPRNIGACWRRGSDSSISSTSSSIYSSSSAASPTSTLASSANSLASDKSMPMQRPSTAAPRLEGTAAYIPPRRRGSREDIMQKTSWR